MDKKQAAILKELQRGVQTLVTNKFFRILCECDEDLSLRAKCITMIGSALGETLDKVTFPTHWQRLLARKDCPQYMKQLTQIQVNAYYPKLSLPEEDNWVTLDKSYTDTEAQKMAEDLGD